MKYLVIAGHGKRANGTFDPGATGRITKGEHRYVKENLFPAMKKYAGKDFIFFDSYNVFSHANIVSLARRYGKDTAVIEIHFDASSNGNARGGHVIVHSRFRPDAMDLRIRDAINNVVGINLAYHHYKEPGISGRSNLANVNRTANGGINYRMVELGFGTNKKDADILINRVDEYAKELVRAISGELKVVKPIAPGKPVAPSTEKSIETLAQETIRGDYGTGQERKERLGSKYNAVQSRVNQILKGGRKSNSEIAREIAFTKHSWGNNPERARKLRSAGYDADAIQKEVNQLLSGRNAPKNATKRTIRAGDTITTRALYATAESNKNVRKSSIRGYVSDIDNNRRNSIRLRTKKGGPYLGFTRNSDIL